jgi:hypothetical protein
MKHALTPIIVTALILAGTQAFADDATPSDSMTNQHKQMMQDCMAKQKAKNNNMSTDDMKQACKAEVKTKMNNAQMNNGESNDAMDNGHPQSAPPQK